jgi:hypothetical protein
MINNMKNFFSEYGFNRDVAYVSKTTSAGFNYPTSEAKKAFNCKNFLHDHYDTEIPMHSAIMEGYYNTKVNFDGNVVLTSNYTPEMPIMLSNKVVNVDLNGKKVIAPIFEESNGSVKQGATDSYAFWVQEGADLTIEGDGEVIASEANYSMAVWAAGGKVTIKGGKFYNNGDNSDLIYASGNALVEIYGGEFHANENKGASGTKNAYPALNIKDKDRATAKIVVYGGKFYGFDPANNVSEGSNTNFVAEGYKSVEVEPGVWEVIAE